MRTKYWLLSLLSLLSLVALASCPSTDSWQTTSYQEGKSPKEVKYLVWAPTGEPRAIILLSHGFSGRPDLHRKLALTLTEAGYYVVAPQHDDIVTIGRDGRLIKLDQARLKQALEDVTKEIQQIPDCENYLQDGAWDLLFEHCFQGEITDQRVLEIFNRQFHYRIQEAKAALKKEWEDRPELKSLPLIGIGHSLGGNTILEMGGEQENLMSAEILMSPVCGLSNLPENKMPTLWQTGTADKIKTQKVAKFGFENVGGPAIFINWLDVNHLGFADQAIKMMANIIGLFRGDDLPSEIEDDSEKSQAIAELTTAWLDEQLIEVPQKNFSVTLDKFRSMIAEIEEKE